MRDLRKRMETARSFAFEIEGTLEQALRRVTSKGADVTASASEDDMIHIVGQVGKIDDADDNNEGFIAGVISDTTGCQINEAHVYQNDENWLFRADFQYVH